MYVPCHIPYVITTIYVSEKQSKWHRFVKHIKPVEEKAFSKHYSSIDFLTKPPLCIHLHFQI